MWGKRRTDRWDTWLDYSLREDEEDRRRIPTTWREADAALLEPEESVGTISRVGASESRTEPERRKKKERDSRLREKEGGRETDRERETRGGV